MKLMIDTCSWFKLERLSRLGLFDANNLYKWAEIQITHDVEKELDYWQCSVWKKERTQILPVKNEKIFNEAILLGYDIADASILSNGSKDPDFFIVSEDRAMIKYLRLYRFSSIQIIDLFRILTRLNFISRTELYRLAKYLRINRNITKRKLKSIKKWLRSF